MIQIIFLQALIEYVWVFNEEMVMNNRFKILLMVILLNGVGLSASSAAGQDINHANNKTIPLEAGQSAFTAIAEIVDMLITDPNTDWETVNIDALRKHLVDMNELTLYAVVEKTVLENVVSFKVIGKGRVLQAIRTMVPRHATQLSKIKSWEVTTKLNENSVILSIYTNDKNQLKKIQALGFFGVMALEAHHQAHHWAMAKEKTHGQ